MLNTNICYDMNDLGAMCRNTLDVAEILEQYAGEVDMPQEESARENTERLISSIVVLTDKIREITAIASVLDGYERPEHYGFPHESCEMSRTADFSEGFTAGYTRGTFDALEKAQGSRSKPMTASQRENIIASIIDKLDKLGFVSHDDESERGGDGE